MRAIDPILLDRDLETAAQTANTWLRSLKEAPSEPHNPLHRFRLLLGQARFDEISDLPEHDPLRTPLRRCIAKYAEVRINHAWLSHAAVQRYSATHALTEPCRTLKTIDQMLKAALQEGSRSAWVKAMFHYGSACTETHLNLWQRRVEIANRLGLVSSDELELPLPSTELTAHAEAWLDRTEAMAEEFRCSDFAEWLPLALGTDSTEGWPAALSERNLARWFRQGPLLEGLRLDTPQMPRAIGAASYVRALAELGFAVREAGSSHTQPFSIAHDPHALESHGLGMCFARLLSSAPFIQRNLGLTGGQASDLMRCVGRVLLLESRNRAAKVIMRAPAQEGASALREAYPSLVHRTFGSLIPEAALGVLLTPQVGDPARFCGVFVGEVQFEQYTETHDEDWFRNPRAIDNLRSALQLPPQTETTQAALSAGADLLHARLSTWL